MASRRTQPQRRSGARTHSQALAASTRGRPAYLRSQADIQRMARRKKRRRKKRRGGTPLEKILRARRRHY